jgi:hypothetical protein
MESHPGCLADRCVGLSWPKRHDYDLLALFQLPTEQMLECRPIRSREVINGA